MSQLIDCQISAIAGIPIFDRFCEFTLCKFSFDFSLVLYYMFYTFLNCLHVTSIGVLIGMCFSFQINALPIDVRAYLCNTIGISIPIVMFVFGMFPSFSYCLHMYFAVNYNQALRVSFVETFKFILSLIRGDARTPP